VKLEGCDPPTFVDFISILSAPDWKERLSLPEHSGLGSVDILPLLVILSHAKGGRGWCLEVEISSSGSMSFTTDWDRFIHDNGLLYGNILRFCFLGDGRFLVYVWNNLWCRVTMPPGLM
jgi:hypothetical protein